MEISLYDELKALRKKTISDRVCKWENTLLDIITAMFDYKGFPDTVRPEFIELYLNLFGSCAIWETKEGYAVTPCNRAGSPNVNGLGKDLICITRNGESKTFSDFENRTDVVYFRNDKFENPDLIFENVADLLANTDKSLKHITINARFTPIPIARNDIEKTAIEGALNANNESECKPQAIVSENVLSELIEGKEREIRVLNLTDVDASDKIQYIHKSKEDILRNFYNLYGMETCGGSKMAQQSVAEINSGCNSHLIIPQLRLEEREKAVSKCAEFFGWSCSVAFSTCWKREEEEKETTPEQTEQTEESEVQGNEETI